MTSKLHKQKQIFSMLNSRALPIIEQPSQGPQTPSRKPTSGLGPQTILLHQVYHFHKNIIQNLNAGLFTLDLSGEITFANKGAAELLQYEVPELLGRNITQLFSNAQHANRVLELCSLPGKKIDEWETRFFCKDGREIVVELNASHLVDNNNNFEGIVMLFRDVTEVYHLRTQVARMERLALLGELSAGIAHEIRNPLAGIKAATQVLEELSELDTGQAQLVQRIIREVDKANGLLKEFFKFARPAKPKLGFFSIDAIIDSVYLLLAPRLRKQNIQFTEKFQDNVPKVYVDETQIEQVLLNLFLNAIDSMEAGGQLSVTTATKQVTLLEEQQAKLARSDQELYYVVIKVSDTGSGIPPDQLEKIFNPFFTTKQEGVGLGLSICSRLIEENRGKIEVFSEPGKGTTFVIALPTFVHK